MSALMSLFAVCVGVLSYEDFISIYPDNILTTLAMKKEPTHMRESTLLNVADSKSRDINKTR